MRVVKRGRFVPNVAANTGTFAFNVLVGLWYTPYLIRHLGVGSYGLIPLITQVVGYLAIVTVALNSAVGRYITIDLERGNHAEANRYFNASFFGSLALVAVMVIPAGFATYHIDKLISVPAGQETQVRWLTGCVVAVFFLSALLTPFGIATYCTNRFDLRNAVSIAEYLVRVGVVVACFALLSPQLWQVGLALVGATLVSGGLTLGLWRRLMPMLRVSISDFDIRAVGKLASFGGWVAVNQVGAILYLAVDLIVVNRMFGPVAGGRYAAALQWSGLLRSLTGVVATVFGPTMLYIYARNDFDGLVSYARRAMKLTGLAIALPIGLICGLSGPLLGTWLGPGFVGLAPLMSLMTIHLSVNLAVTPLFAVQTATNRVSVPGIVTLVMGAANLGLALLLAGPVGWGLYGVAAAGAIMLTAKNLVFTPIYTACCLKRSPLVFFRQMFGTTSATIVTAVSCYGLARLVDLSGWFRLGTAAAAVSLVYLAIVLLTLVTADERVMFREAVRSLVRSGQ